MKGQTLTGETQILTALLRHGSRRNNKKLNHRGYRGIAEQTGAGASAPHSNARLKSHLKCLLQHGAG